MGAQHTIYPVVITAGLVMWTAGSGCSIMREARAVQEGALWLPGERTTHPGDFGLGVHSVVSLEKAVRMALSHHPAVLQASQTLAMAECEYRQAIANYGPSVELSAGVSRSSANTQEDRSNGETRDAYTANLMLDTLVYDFGKTPATVREAGERRAAAYAEWREAFRQAVHAVRMAFFGLAKAEELVAVAEEAVCQSEVYFEQARTFAETGRRTPYDVMRAEVDLRSAELERIQAQLELRNARAAFIRTLGLAEDPGFRIAPATLPEPPGRVEECVTNALSRHPERMALRARVRMASAAVDRAIAECFPSLGVQAEYGASGPDFPLVENWAVKIRAGVSLFTSGRATLRIQEAVAQLHAARARLADWEQRLTMEVRQAWNRMEAARQKVAVGELAERSAQANLDVVTERYRVGSASAVELADARAALVRAKGDRARACWDVQLALSDLWSHLGDDLP